MIKSMRQGSTAIELTDKEGGCCMWVYATCSFDWRLVVPTTGCI